MTSASQEKNLLNGLTVVMIQAQAILFLADTKTWETTDKILPPVAYSVHQEYAAFGRKDDGSPLPSHGLLRAKKVSGRRYGANFLSRPAIAFRSFSVRAELYSALRF